MLWRAGLRVSPLLRVACAISALAGCEPRPLSAPALPLTVFDRPGTMAEWADRGDPTCAFPRQADAAKIDAAEVVLRVLVSKDGSPKAVQTLDEPGLGFGEAATRCAMARMYEPGKNERGIAIAAWTPPIRLKFIR